MEKMEKVKVYTETVGQSFGTAGIVKVGRKVVHITRTFPYGFTAPAIAAAERWAKEKGLAK